MQNLKDRLNTLNPIYLIWGYLLLLLILTYFKIQPYNYNLSSLIGLWKGFAELNPSLIDKAFVIYNDGGYDGQFFYLIAKSLFTEGLNSFPIMDSFFIRFNRIGLSLLAGFLSSIFGFGSYPIITLCLLTLFHIYSFKLLFGILDTEIKYLSYFYLFSPFSLNSNLLLVSDSLFASFLIICIYVLKINGFNLDNLKLAASNRSYNFISIFLTITFLCFIRESGIIIAGTLLLLSFLDREIRISIILLLSLGTYLLIIELIKLIPSFHHGTNPLGFLDLIDYPLFGFFKSIKFQSLSGIKNIFRELAKFPIFIFYIILALNLTNIKNRRDLILYIPIYFILFTAGVGEVGYWLSFDNISRMFTISLPWLIFLKQEKKAHNDYYALRFSFIVLLLLIIRIIYIKTPMEFYIFQ
ncbi:MAG: hypothetical protein KBF99_01005 [Leptospiraceae bacterium]|nr:hypothetical protein [Leptospiraceae bacterium]